ncbi:MAG: hypothetical protein Aurels2KO_12010 [Aureliella sp.]
MRFALLVASLFCIPFATSAQDTEKPKQSVAPDHKIKKEDVPKVTTEKPMDFWMKHKLDHSKTLLESLTMGDFEKLAATAGQMRLLGRIEELARRRSPEYEAQVKGFDRALLELIRRSDKKDTDGATAAFNRMTTSCVKCHKLLRAGPPQK